MSTTDAIDVFYGPSHWAEKANQLAALAAESDDPLAKAYADRARSIAKFMWEPGDLDVLREDGSWSAVEDTNQQPYGLVVRDQAGGLGLLERLGAMEEIYGVVTDHCEEFRPNPPYKPELLKNRLETRGWLREARVPPPSPDLDALPINDRYDALKFFESDSSQIGVAVEIEGWEINNDLLKFWRGFTRGQIQCGVIIQPDPRTLHYCFDQMRLLTGPLFGQIPVVFVAPAGEGLNRPLPRKPRTFAQYPMPRQS